MNTATQTKNKIQHATQHTISLQYPLPKSWVKAAGILSKKKKVNGLLYQKKLRKEWEKRLKHDY